MEGWKEVQSEEQETGSQLKIQVILAATNHLYLIRGC